MLKKNFLPLLVAGGVLLLAHLVGGAPFSQRLSAIRLKDDRFEFRKELKRRLASSIHVLLGAETNEHGQVSLRRNLAPGDFATFNELFKNAVIDLPDATVSKKLLFKLKIKIKDLYCQDISIEDILLSFNKESDQRLTFGVMVQGLALNCFAKYDYDYGLLDGGGRVEIYSNRNSAETRIAFSSPNFNQEPPESATVEYCNANINIYNMEIRGKFIGKILDTFQKLIRDVVEDEVEDVACKELSSLGTTFVADILELAKEEMGVYLKPIASDRSNPLYLENSMTVAAGTTLLDFQDIGNTIGSWVNNLLGEADKVFGDTVDDIGGPTGTDTDLGANVFLRKNLLDEDRALTINFADLPFDDFDPVIFDSHDVLTETTITLDGFRLFGLDTFERFDPLIDIGQYTLQNEFTWTYLKCELDATVTIKPSTKEDSILIDPDPNVVVKEEIKISFGVENLDVVVSLLLALDQDKLGDLQLGSLLRTENLLGCFISVIHQIDLAGLAVSVGSIYDPVLEGFVSNGIDRVVSSAVEAVFLMYEPTLIRAIPSIFQGPVRDILQDIIVGGGLFDPDSRYCPLAQAVVGDVIDYRDLFLEPEESKSRGGSGAEPYGDVGPLLYGIVQDRLVSAKGSGLPPINDMLVRPATKAQSGVEGMLRFPSDILSFVEDDIDFGPLFSRFEVKVSDIRVRNLDTVVAPMSLIEPTNDPSVVENFLNAATNTGRPLELTLRLLIALDSQVEPLDLLEEVDISVSAESLELFMDLLAIMSSSTLLEFPARDLLNVNCWLATLPAAELNENGVSIDPNVVRSLALETFLTTLSTLSIKARCIDCTSAGTELLPELLDILEQSGAIRTFGYRLDTFVQALLQSGTVQTQLDRLLHDAPYFCPFHQKYNATAVRSDYGSLGIPALPAEALDTMLYSAVLGAEIGFIVLTENHRQHTVEDDSSPLSAQESFNTSDGVRLLDWTDIGTSIGVGSIADRAFEQIRTFLGGVDEAGALNVNNLVKGFLGDDGVLAADFDDISGDLDDFVIELLSVRVKGLDSFTLVDVLEPIAPQTLRNSLDLSFLKVEIELSIDLKSTEDPPQKAVFSFEFSDLSARITLFAAFDLDKLASMAVGSLLRTSDILPCILATAHEIGIPQMLVSIGNFTDPTVEGLMPDTAAAVAASISAMIERFRTEIGEAIPVIFDTTVRDILNEVLAMLVADSKCPDPLTGTTSEYIDFRKMFDVDSDGEYPYGDVPIILKELLTEEFLSEGSVAGMARMNEAVIDPLTEAQSGEKGFIRSSTSVFEIAVDALSPVGLDSLQLNARDVSLANLNTFQVPMELLEPNATSGFLLDNRAALGAQPNPLRLGFQVLLATTGDPILSSRNELEVRLEFAELDIFAVLFARIIAGELMNYPLGRISDMDCMLSVFATPQLDSNGLRLPAAEPGLAMDALVLALSSLRFRTACTSNASCTSAGFRELSSVLEMLDLNGVTAVLQNRLFSLATILFDSEYLQTVIDRLLVDSSKRCPEHRDFVDRDHAVSYSSPPFPSLSLASLETIALAAVYGIEVGSVVVAETHNAYPTEVDDPLSSQNDLDEPVGTQFIDFSDLSTSIGAWADALLSQLRSYIGEPIQDPKSPNGVKDLGINVVFRSFLGVSRTLSLNTNGAVFGASTMHFAVRSIHISGLDTFTKFDVLDAIGPQTLRNQVALEKLRLELDLTISSEAEELDISASVELTNVEASLSLLLAIDQNAIGDLEMGQLLSTDRILKCLLSTARAVDITEMDISVGAIAAIEVKGFKEPDSLGAAESLTLLILERYGDVLASSIRPIFNRSVKAMLNNLLGYYLAQETDLSCPKRSFESTGQEYVDLRDLLVSKDEATFLGGTGLSPYGDLFRRAIQLVKENILKVDPETGISSVNGALITSVTDNGRLTFPGDIFDQGTRISVGGLDANVRFKAYDAYADNLDTIGTPLSILDPVNGRPHLLNNTASIGVGRPLRLGTRFFIAITGDDSEIKNDLEISLDMNTLNVVLTALLKIQTKSLFSFPVRDVPHIHCWLAMMPAPPLDAKGVRLEDYDTSFSLAELAASVAKLNLNISCVECSSPGMYELMELLSTPEASEDATEVANDIFDYVTKLLGGQYLQVKMDRMLNDAKRRCPHSPLYDSNDVAVTYESFASPEQESSIRFFVLLGIVAGSLLVAVFSIVTIVKLIVRRRNRRWIRSVPTEKLLLLWQQQKKEQEKESELNKMTRSMFKSPEIPLWLRLLMPLVILGNIGFFLSGHLSLGATVNIEATLADQSFKVSDFFEFSMMKSTVEIWNAGGKELSIMILIFSGIWPYTKQLITLALWFLPPTIVSISKRGSIFLWLDALAKWSMVDIFVLVITVAGFRISVQSPDVGFLPEDFYSLDLLVVPMWGLYANMIAQLISQVSSHFIIHYHRQIQEKASHRYEERHALRSSDTVVMDMEDDDEDSSLVRESPEPHRSPECSESMKEKLCSHAYERPHRGESEKVVVRRGVNRTLVCTAVAISVLAIVGCVLPSFSLEILGIIGIMVESGQRFEQAKTEQSVFTIIGMLFDQAKFTGKIGDYLGLGTLSVLLLFTVLIVPIFQSLVLVYQWFRPLGQRRRHRVSILVEILQAWQYAEVYLLAVLVASWQLGPVSDFMINSYCSSLKDTFAQMVYYGIIDENDAQCFRVESRIESASYVLAAAAVLLALLDTFVMKAVAQYFRDKDNLKEERKISVADHADDMDMSEMRKQIKPPPVLFTDSFRWFLAREDSRLSRRQLMGLDEDSKLGIHEPFPDVDEQQVFIPTISSGTDHMADTMADSGEELVESMVPFEDEDDEDVTTRQGMTMGVPLLAPSSIDSSSSDSSSTIGCGGDDTDSLEQAYE